MRRIETYLLRQLGWPTLAAVMALTTLAVLSQMLTTLNLIVDQRQSAIVFLKVVALSLPSTAVITLPIALFVACLVSFNRLHTEQEIVVCFAGGMSRWRVSAPAMRLAVAAALLTLVVNLWVQPWSTRRMREELFKVRTDLVATLVHEGEFNEPSQGLTVYAQDADGSGKLRNVFIYQDKGQGRSATFAGKRGLIAKQGGKPVLILSDGSNQQFNNHDILNFLKFDDYVFDLAPYVNTTEEVHYKISDRYPHELFFPDKRYDWERNNKKKMLAEGNARLTSPIYNVTFVILALNAVLGGAFSRLGYGRRIAIAAAAAGALRILGFAAQAACDATPALNLLQWLIPLIPAAWIGRRLFSQAGLRSLGQGQALGAAPLQRLPGVIATVPGLGRIQRYVLVRTLWGVGMALAVISAIILLVDFVSISRDVGVRAKDSSVGQLIGLTLLQSPSVILILFPFAFLFGVLGAFANLNRRSELTAMRAAGVSAWRFTLPAAAAAGLIGLFSIMTLNPVTSAMNDRYERDKAVVMSGYLDVGPKTLWLRQGSKTQQVFVRAAAREGVDGVRLKDVSMFVFSVEQGGALVFSRRYDAQEARLVHGSWVLRQVREGAPGQPATLIGAISLPSTLDERSALERFSSTGSIPFWSLPGMIARTEAAGFSATAYRLQWQQLLATPLMYAAMAILAAAFSLRLQRLGGLAALAGAGVGLGFLFFFVGQLCQALGRAEVAPVALAAWAPASLALLAGVSLLLYTEDG